MKLKGIFVLLAFFLLAPAFLRAQSVTTPNVSDQKAEIGFFYSGVNLKGFGETISGVGGRFGYNLNKYVAIDTEFGFYPEQKFGNNQSGQKVQAFAGVKVGKRSGRVGVFAKARPGVMFIGELTTGLSCNSTSSGQVCRPRHSNFAADLGGVLEVYPSPRTIIRFDAGDTIVRLKSQAGISSTTTVNSTTNNFQFSVGFGYRF